MTGTNPISFVEAVERLRPKSKPLETGGGPPDPPDMTGERVAKLEAQIPALSDQVKDLRTDVRELRTAHDRDFRLTFGAIIAATLMLAGLLAKGFKWL